MKKRIALLVCLSILINGLVYAQSADTLRRPGIQVSLITCGPGAEIYSVFGHTALRIVDTAANTDIVYNYGTFDGYGEDFELNFMRGKVLYYLSDEDYNTFVGYYGMDGRWVEEQVLQINERDKRLVQQYIEENLLPDNKYYKYDFFFDNCATRVRDIFTRVLGASFHYPNVLPEAQGLTYREIINRYLYKNPWERMGINMLLGSKIDKPMSNEEVMFLPDYLEDAVAGAQWQGKALAKAPFRLIKDAQPDTPRDQLLNICLYALLLLMLVGLLVKRMKVLVRIVAAFMLIVTGLLGTLMLLMWFATDHQACADNFNLLWALPTNLLYLFRPKQYKYAIIGIIGILLSFILHIMGVQGLLLPEMAPFLTTLLLAFAYYYRKYKIKISDGTMPVRS